MTPPAFFAPFTSTPSSSTGGVILKVIIAQFECMNAHLDTFSDELCQVNTSVVVSHDDRLSWLVSPHLHLHRL